ncbi:unnamed protein product [Cuscuta epithymum]|uniref:RING-type E3 ubiquitin transferase n=1 Tax=Cuscuta epithymum TaxID=186058 RepID=A0AAV0EY79_9ASTE|nr:unnamed protein product [Cuscuta epithymum]
MAARHRRLLSYQNSTCVEGDGCYYPGFGDYFPPLPPPPPPQSRAGKHSLSLSQDAVIAGVVVVSSIFIISYYLVVVRNCFGWIRRRPAAQGSPDGGNQEFLDENRGPMIDHPIWYIRTIGLQPSIINTITILKYKLGDGLIEGTDCSVCLSEFREDETLRLLPKCNHAFHIRCIDTWLRSHTNCPLCRAAVVSTAVTPARTPNPPGSAGSESIQEPEIPYLPEIQENRETSGEEQAGDHESNHDGDRKPDGIDVGNNIMNTTRSLSLDSSIAAGFLGERVARVGGVARRSSPGRNPRTTGGGSGGGSIAACLHKGPVLMKKSFSYGGRSMLSRH